MAVAFDAKGTVKDVVVSSLTDTSLTIGTGGSNYALVVYVCSQSTIGAPTYTVTWNGVTVPLVGTPTWVAASSGGTALFCLAGPATGNHTLSVSTSVHVAGELHVIAASFTGVDQTTPAQNPASATGQTNTTATISVTSATGNIATAIFAQDQQPNNSTNGTNIVLNNVGPGMGCAANYIAGSATATLTATAGGSATDWTISAMDLLAASGGGPTLMGASQLIFM